MVKHSAKVWKGKKKSVRVGKTSKGGGGRGIQVSVHSPQLGATLHSFSAEFLESGFPFGGNQQTADVRAAGCTVLSVSDWEGLLRMSADTALQGKRSGPQSSVMELIKKKKVGKVWFLILYYFDFTKAAYCWRPTFKPPGYSALLFRFPYQGVTTTIQVFLLKNPLVFQQKKKKNNFQLTPDLEQKLEHCSKSLRFPSFRSQCLCTVLRILTATGYVWAIVSHLECYLSGTTSPLSANPCYPHTQTHTTLPSTICGTD